MNRDAVWITGVGTATPLGLTFDAFADALLAGTSGIGPITRFDAGKHTCKIAGCLPEIPCPPGWYAPDFAVRSDWEQVFLWTALQALHSAGLWESRQKLRIGLCVGIGSEWLLTWEADMLKGGDRVKDPTRDAAGQARAMQTALEFTGPVSTVAAACASGNVALGIGRQWLRQGRCDVVLAGACDRSVTPMGVAGFANMGALSKRNESPTTASRPFDRNRDGFVMSEGAALFVLEPAESAKARGAVGLAELAGYGASSDACHMVTPSTDPVPAAAAVRSALEDAGLTAESVDYMNAHATSTPLGDAFEANVLRAGLGEHAARVPVSATKSMTGHLLGAAAAVEAAACIAAIQRGAIPPTINLDDLDPACELNHVRGSALETPVRVAVSNSFGFGGSNTCVVLKAIA